MRDLSQGMWIWFPDQAPCRDSQPLDHQGSPETIPVQVTSTLPSPELSLLLPDLSMALDQLIPLCPANRSLSCPMRHQGHPSLFITYVHGPSSPSPLLASLYLPDLQALASSRAEPLVPFSPPSQSFPAPLVQAPRKQPPYRHLWSDLSLKHILVGPVASVLWQVPLRGSQRSLPVDIHTHHLPLSASWTSNSLLTNQTQQR